MPNFDARAIIIILAVFIGFLCFAKSVGFDSHAAGVRSSLTSPAAAYISQTEGALGSTVRSSSVSTQDLLENPELITGRR